MTKKAFNQGLAYHFRGLVCDHWFLVTCSPVAMEVQFEFPPEGCKDVKRASQEQSKTRATWTQGQTNRPFFSELGKVCWRGRLEMRGEL